MDAGAVLIQLKPLHMQQAHDWQCTLKARQDEVIERLKAEQVHVESWFYLQLYGQDYLIAYMRADNIQKAQNIAKLSTFQLTKCINSLKLHGRQFILLNCYWILQRPDLLARLFKEFCNKDYPRSIIKKALEIQGFFDISNYCLSPIMVDHSRSSISLPLK